MKLRSLACLTLFAGLLSAAQTSVMEPKNLFFVIDVSGSMETNKIFQPLKNEIANYIQAEANKGDYVSIITFGTDVKLIAGQRISHENTATDIALLVEKVKKLAAKEQHTHMTRALDLLASQMGLVKSANPVSMVKAFLFTDGKNEPPPGAEGASWTFEQILQKHYDIFENPSTYLFIITLGIQPDEGLVKAAEEKKGKIFINAVPDVSKLEERKIIPREVPKEEPKIEPKSAPVLPKVRLAYSGPSKITARADSQYDLVIEIKDLNREAMDKTLSLDIEIKPSLNFTSSIREITLKKRGKQSIPISLERPIPGPYTIRTMLRSAEEMEINPAEFESQFLVVKPNYLPIFILLILLITGIGGWIIIRQIPRFTEDHVIINTKEGLTYELKDKQKWYSSTVASKDLDITDAEFKLKIIRKTGEIFCRVLIDGQWTDKVVQSGEMVVDPYKFKIRMV